MEWRYRATEKSDRQMRLVDRAATGSIRTAARRAKINALQETRQRHLQRVDDIAESIEDAWPENTW
jgi:hypothetical protein